LYGNIAYRKLIPMDVHLIDGTYELFRYYFAVPSVTDATGRKLAQYVES
jgi:hypothetical protein